MEEIQVLGSRLYKNLDISHKCMKSCNRLNGIVVEKFQEFVCKFLELKSRLWNKLPERKRENMYDLKGRQKSIRLPNRTMPRKASFQTISSVLVSSIKTYNIGYFRSNLFLKGNMIANQSYKKSSINLCYFFGN